MQRIKLLTALIAFVGALVGIATSVSAEEEVPMACEAFVTAPYCCYCDHNGNVGSCGVTTEDGVIECTRHLCPDDKTSCFQA